MAGSMRRMGSPASIVRAALVGCAAIALAACTSAFLAPDLATEAGVKQAGGEPLAGPQSRAVLGRVVRYRWTTARGAQGYALLDGKGAIRTFWETDAVNGRIRFTETGYCTRYRNVRNGKEDCYRLYRMAANEYRVFREDGQFSGTITILPPS